MALAYRQREACFVVCADVFGSSELAQIEELTTAYAISRILIVCPLTPEHVRTLDTLGLIARTVWLRDVPGELAGRVSEILGSHFLEQAMEALNTAVATPDAVARFIAAVWASPRPPTTVEAGAALAETNYTTLREQWVSLGVQARLKDVVDWAILGRALTERQTSVSWDRAAYRVRTTVRTLLRIAQRRLGGTLSDVDAQGPAWVTDEFWNWFDHLLGAASGHFPDGHM